MNVSVAMTTYNGAKYLPEQLQSIANQTRLPDEVVIVDDQSSDRTRDITGAFAEDVSFPIRLHVNKINLGPIKNFERAVELCTGEIIILCDQDDWWYPEKLFSIEQSFSKSPKIGLVFSDADLIDEHGNFLNRRLWQYTFEEDLKRPIRSGKAFETLLQHDVVTGATMAFRECFRKSVLPFPTGIPLLHDGWIALIIAAIGNLSMLRQPLIRYRLHQQQTQGIEPFNQTQPDTDGKDISTLSKRSSYYCGQIEKLKVVGKRLNGMSRMIDAGIPLETIELRNAYIEKLITHLSARGNLPEGKIERGQMVLKELVTLRYHRYSRGWLSVLRDLTI